VAYVQLQPRFRTEFAQPERKSEKSSTRVESGLERRINLSFASTSFSQLCAWLTASCCGLWLTPTTWGRKNMCVINNHKRERERGSFCASSMLCIGWQNTDIFEIEIDASLLFFWKHPFIILCIKIYIHKHTFYTQKYTPSLFSVWLGTRSGDAVQGGSGWIPRTRRRTPNCHPRYAQHNRYSLRMIIWSCQLFFSKHACESEFLGGHLWPRRSNSGVTRACEFENALLFNVNARPSMRS